MTDKFHASGIERPLGLAVRSAREKAARHQADLRVRARPATEPVPPGRTGQDRRGDHGERGHRGAADPDRRVPADPGGLAARPPGLTRTAAAPGHLA